MTTNEKINALRQEMKKENMAAYYVPTDDFHGSEYVSDYFKCREYLSGFTGSAGVLVVTDDFAGLWTDGRYFIQAQQQLENTEIQLMKMGEPGVPTIEEFLAENLESGDKLGFDGRCISGGFMKGLKGKLSSKQIFFEGSYDLVDRFWSERPKLSFHPVWELELSQSGIPRKEKLNLVREKMEEKGADAHLLTSLEDIAWLLNLRGGDIHCNPVFLSYLYITKDDCILFAGGRETDEEVFSKDIKEHLSEDGVRLQFYEDVYDFTARLRGQKVLLNDKTVNQRLLDHLSAYCSLIFSGNFTTILKAIKNETELFNMRNAHIKDGAAVTKFLYYMKEYKKDLAAGQWKGQLLTEIKAAEILENFRKEQDGYLGPSFDPIMAYGEHGAIVHYSATEESDVILKAEGFLLFDTGGHYKDGTTDITRTISLAAGPLSEEEKRHYTLVLKANLALLLAKFPKGVCGNSLDALAREHLWAEGLDFNHGTGHGVGYILSVHEGPNAFRTYRGRGEPDITAIVPGMVTSDEPGLYFEGKYGIRLENLIECVEEENGFYGFGPLTFVPFDRESIEPDLLNNREKFILNSYHKQVCDKISICLGEKEKEWLKKETAPIN
ncbi:MAG: aminopeptidase P family protein [Lachnospiraceae bacterium]|nr:aminopeptidase P family protein [Lachnospiraceae bacterium]